MKKLFIILTFLIFQHNILAQEEIIGRVEYYKSFTSEWEDLESSTDKQLNRLNSRRHKINIIQGDKKFEFKTDSTGLFKFITTSKDTIFIDVNKPSKIINHSFRLNQSTLIDTIKLRISDYRVALYLDSIQAPEFYKKYNEKQAQLDFDNGNAKILSGQSFLDKKGIKQREAKEKEFGYKHVYIFGCLKPRAEKRIAFRYNAIMRKLIGIKNVW